MKFNISNFNKLNNLKFFDVSDNLGGANPDPEPKNKITDKDTPEVKVLKQQLQSTETELADIKMQKAISDNRIMKLEGEIKILQSMIDSYSKQQLQDETEINVTIQKPMDADEATKNIVTNIIDKL